MDTLLKKTALSALIAAPIYLALFFFLDRDIALWAHDNLTASWVFNLGEAISTLATGSYIKLAIAAGMIFVVIIDPRLKKFWTRNLLYLCLSCSIAIIVGEGLKYLLGRNRPIMLFEQNLYGLNFFSSKWALNSSPSGHTLRAFSLLTGISLLFRRWRPFCLLLALIIGISRVIVTAHYPSDVLFGAFIGIFSALWTKRYFFPEKNLSFPDK